MGFDENRNIYLEYASGGSLDLYFSEKTPKKLSRTELSKIIFRIALGMKFLHAIGIIHRDLKPGNIFLDKQMNAMIGDFSSSKRSKILSLVDLSRDSGTRIYQSPEIIKGASEIDFSVDVWSFGMILYHLETGNIPFKTDKSQSLLQLYSKRQFPEFNISTDSWISELCLRCWEIEPLKRPSFEEIVTLFVNDGYYLSGADEDLCLRYYQQQSSLF